MAIALLCLRAAVTAAFTEYVRSRRRRQILKWRGRVDYFDDYDYKALRRRRGPDDPR